MFPLEAPSAPEMSYWRARQLTKGPYMPLQVAHSYVNSFYIIGPQWRCWGRPLAPAVFRKREQGSRRDAYPSPAEESCVWPG